LDFIRELPRMIRRARVRTHYTEGFHPKPDMSFGPALALGIASLGECIDVKLIDPPDPEELVRRLNDVAAAGVRFLGAARLGDSDPGLAKIIDEATYVIAVSRQVLAERAAGGSPEGYLADLVQRFAQTDEVVVERDVKGIKRRIDVKGGVSELGLGGGEHRALLGRAGIVGDLVCLSVRVPLEAQGAVRVREIVEGLADKQLPFVALRSALLAKGESLLSLSTHQKRPTNPRPSDVSAPA
jgi:radical SAM-linked protein